MPKSCTGCNYNLRVMDNIVYCDWLGEFTENKGCPKNPSLCEKCKRQHSDIDGRYIMCRDEVIDTTEITECPEYMS